MRAQHHAAGAPQKTGRSRLWGALAADGPPRSTPRPLMSTGMSSILRTGLSKTKGKAMSYQSSEDLGKTMTRERTRISRRILTTDDTDGTDGDWRASSSHPCHPCHPWLKKHPRPSPLCSVEIPVDLVSEPNSKFARRYDREFKENAVALVRKGRSQNEVSRDLGVAASSLGKWVKQAQSRPGAAPSKNSGGGERTGA